MFVITVILTCISIQNQTIVVDVGFVMYIELEVQRNAKQYIEVPA
jgi:hypothetical protein